MYWELSGTRWTDADGTVAAAPQFVQTLAVSRERASCKIAWSIGSLATLFANPRNDWNQHAPFRMLSCLYTTPGIHFQLTFSRTTTTVRSHHHHHHHFSPVTSTAFPTTTLIVSSMATTTVSKIITVTVFSFHHGAFTTLFTSHHHHTVFLGHMLECIMFCKSSFFKIAAIAIANCS